MKTEIKENPCTLLLVHQNAFVTATTELKKKLTNVPGGGGGRPGQGELATISEAESVGRSGGGGHCWVRAGGGGLDPGLVDHGGVLVDHGGVPGVGSVQSRANITVNPSDSPQSWTPLLQHLSQESNL